jgi:hypothetical protein
MELDEMKQIWATQNKQPLYLIDRKALRNRIQREKSSVAFNISEWISIISYLVAIYLMVGRNPFKPGVNIFLYLEAAWMFATVVFLVIIHIRRIKAGRRFDRSLHGDLDHGIHLINYQMRIAQITRWNLLPLGAIMIFFGWKAGKLFLISTVILVGHTLVFYVVSIGLRMNKRRKRELQVLKEKLETSAI